jgi:6-pyruvoyltetrahydropterin/6-carboxytetrahydropterin synthase
MKVYLTRRYGFSASHRLHSDALSTEENRSTYGKCNNPFGHGHDYVLDVSVEGAVDASGQIVGRNALDTLVQERVLAQVDHRNLNCDLPELRSQVATTENLAFAIERMLGAEWPLAARLQHIRISETERNIFELEMSK